MNDLCFVVVCHGVFAVAVFFGVELAAAVHFQELLDAVIAGCYVRSAFLDDAVFGLDFFEEMLDLGGEVCDWVSC